MGKKRFRVWGLTLFSTHSTLRMNNQPTCSNSGLNDYNMLIVLLHVATRLRKLLRFCKQIDIYISCVQQEYVFIYFIDGMTLCMTLLISLTSHLNTKLHRYNIPEQQNCWTKTPTETEYFPLHFIVFPCSFRNVISATWEILPWIIYNFINIIWTCKQQQHPFLVILHFILMITSSQMFHLTFISRLKSGEACWLEMWFLIIIYEITNHKTRRVF